MCVCAAIGRRRNVVDWTPYKLPIERWYRKRKARSRKSLIYRVYIYIWIGKSVARGHPPAAAHLIRKGKAARLSMKMRRKKKIRRIARDVTEKACAYIVYSARRIIGKGYKRAARACIYKWNRVRKSLRKRRWISFFLFVCLASSGLLLYGSGIYIVRLNNWTKKTMV